MSLVKYSESLSRVTSRKFLPHLGSSVHIYKMTGVDNEPFQLCESTFTPTDLPVQVHTAHQDMCICSLILPLSCHRGSRLGSWLLEGEGEPPAILP